MSDAVLRSKIWLPVSKLVNKTLGRVSKNKNVYTEVEQ